ncbi:Retrovirus-related Pol polyprotein from transposon TNT 1-94 [Nymphaea thermarum]|nr:Retrovirus-related Pol polyprotein from transposon TNT 1-94 [Nymphaea thermarum]
MAASFSSLPGLPAPTSFQHFISTKLDSDNYVLWASQFRPLLISYDFEGFIDVWTTLQDAYAAQSRARILQLKEQLQNLRKGNKSISQFVQKARSIAHHLKVAGKKVEEEDLILHILRGLPPQYEAMRASISIRKDPVSMTELLSLLLSHEAYLGEGDSVEKASDSQVEANVTHRTNQGSGNQYYGRGNYRGGRGGRFRSRGRGRGNYNQ